MFNFRKFINPVRARKRRYQKICQLVNLKAKDKILDLGCGEGLSFENFNQENKIVGLDKSKQRIFQKNFSYCQGDAANLKRFKNKEFDLVVCIGVLEHLFPWQKLRKAAKEIQRVGKKYVVVVPHFYTLIEPHYQLPFWQFYPDCFKSWLIKHFNITWYHKNSRGKFTQLNYFNKQKWLSLFPRAAIISHHHIGGLIRNYIIFKK
jgi:ubiquinone/menaquinone biosynthesis C-methylase UbiE